MRSVSSTSSSVRQLVGTEDQIAGHAGDGVGHALEAVGIDVASHRRSRSTSRLTAPSSVRITTFIGRSSAGRSLEFRHPAQVDRRDDLAAQVDQP